MGYRSQTGSRRGSGEKFQKSAHQKAKSKAQKNKAGKYIEETPAPTQEEIVEKTVSSLTKLGAQTFGLSPFSQYYDDWLINLRQTISEFESGPFEIDAPFTEERTQIFEDIERQFADDRLKEKELEASTKSLAENNHLIVETDDQYASQTRELVQKRNCDLERLTKEVHDLEEEQAKTAQMKTSFFGFTKKAKAQKEAEVAQKFKSAKDKLELAVKNFAIEQERLHDGYEKKKQETIAKVQVLEKEISSMETDNSLEARQTACNALAMAVNALLQRKPASPA